MSSTASSLDAVVSDAFFTMVEGCKRSCGKLLIHCKKSKESEGGNFFSIFFLWEGRGVLGTAVKIFWKEKGKKKKKKWRRKGKGKGRLWSDHVWSVKTKDCAK